MLRHLAASLLAIACANAWAADQYLVAGDAACTSTAISTDADCWASTSGGSDSTGPPGTGDAVILDGGDTTSGTMDGNLSVTSWTVASAYTGTFDADTYNLSVSGNFVADGGTILFGSGTHTFSAVFDLKDAGSSSSYETSTIVFDGTTTNPYTWIDTATNTYMYAVTVAATGVLTFTNTGFVAIRATAGVDVLGTLSHGGLTANGRQMLLFASNLSVSSGGSLTGEGNVEIRATSAGAAGVDDAAGTIDVANLRVFINNTSNDFTLAAGNYESALDIYNNNGAGTSADFILGAGAFTFGDITVTSSTVDSTINTSTNNPNIDLTGDLTANTSLGWVKGTGTITASGPGAQTLDFDGTSIGDFEIDKTANSASLNSASLASAVTVDTLTITDGTINLNGETATVSENMVVADDTTVSDSAATGDLAISGNLTINGTVSNGITWSDADTTTLTGTGTGSYATVSNATNSGTTINCTTGCTDGGGNTGWNFTGTGPPTGTIRINAGRWELWQSGDPAVYLRLNAGRLETVTAAPTVILNAGRLEESP